MPDAAVLSIFGTSFLVGLSGAVSPGPLLAYNIRETVRRGFLAGPYVATGHAIPELLVVVVLALGLSRFIDVDNVTGAIGLLGGLVLLWMGGGMLRNPGQGAPGSAEHRVAQLHAGATAPIIGGAVVSLSNPF